ncbi:MAG: hypothetical protein JST54_13170 [Deltaproteobacteria bacterium]|nr:hypothetical protein [Deltaproteobacteria bacterium]
MSQDLGPDSSLHLYQSTDEGQSFTQVATLLAPQDRLPNEQYPDGGAVTLDGGPGVYGGRDLRDPHFFIVNDTLHFIALTRLGTSNKKRTALYELTGNLEGGPLGIEERVVLPSAGDTSYAGGVKLASGDWLFSWYSGDPTLDEPWVPGHVRRHRHLARDHEPRDAVTFQS